VLSGVIGALLAAGRPAAEAAAAAAFVHARTRAVVISISDTRQRIDAEESCARTFKLGFI
jgi:NAD(P)H-hydrate repair Nnr-like enzyme with NAD(P)H-hydrate dehydratase domain